MSISYIIILMQSVPDGFKIIRMMNTSDQDSQMNLLYAPEMKGKAKTHLWSMVENHSFDFIPDSYESYYLIFLLDGEMEMRNNGELLRAGDSVKVSNARDYAVFKTLSPCRVLLISLGDYDFQKSYGSHSSLLEDYVRRINNIDHYTYGHSLRVKYLSLELALYLNRSDIIIEALYFASLYHDAGKINIPEEVLNHPGALGENQFQTIRKHPYDSYELIKGIMDERTSDIVLQHHERLDGSGYPRGLKGDEILPESKIIALCDCFDAISSKRVYSDSHDTRETLEIIREQEEGRLDSTMIDALEAMLYEEGYFRYHIPHDFVDDYIKASIAETEH